MSDIFAAALQAAPPPADLPGWATPAIALALAGTCSFALLRSALLRVIPARVIEPIESPGRRARIESLLNRADSLAVSARALQIISELVFLALLVRAVGGKIWQTWTLVRVLAIGVPVLLFVGEVLPRAMAHRCDGLLRRTLAAFYLVQLPLQLVVRALFAVRRALMRVFGVREEDASARRIVQGLRGVIEESELKGDLAETEREIIENVMEFHDADVAEVMTPRTEMSAIDVQNGLDAAVRMVTESRHSRIPIYEDGLDKIVGIVSARDVIQAIADGRYEKASLRDVMRPAHFVPETKLVSELLAEFRRDKIKMAIVLDEYGGTAGIVTMGDILSEIVGEIHDEWDEDAPEPIRRLEHGAAEVEASCGVSEVNEELGLSIPEEEDYETLGGFVLAEFGHFPKCGETFVRRDVEFTVLEANDRRVLRVGIRQLVPDSKAG